MKQNRKNLLCLLLVLVAPALALAQSKLVLPQSAEDIRQLTKEDETAPCIKCARVTSVRSENRERKPVRPTMAPPAPGIGNSVTTTPILGSGNAVKDAKAAKKPTTYYKVTVRYDDGMYAVFEQDDKPELQQGDRVETSSGRLARRPD